VLKDSGGSTINTYDNLYGILGTIPAVSSAFTTGMIMIWSGSIGSIPSGWVLCNGSNGAPDLRNRFIIGAGDAYSVAQTGGSADAIVVSHTHTATSVVTDPGHTHTMTNASYVTAGTSTYSNGGSGPTAYGTSSINTATTGITVATTNTSTGVSGTNANLPPYYALAYIFKL
jgi:hypothetical protein